MRTPLAVVVGGCAVLAVFALPPQTRSDPDGPVITPQEVRATALGRELVAANETARRLEWVDSLLPLVRGAADHDTPFAVGIVPGLADQAGDPHAGQAEVVRELTQEVKLIGVSRPAVDLGVFIVNAKSDGVAERVGYASNHYEWYAGVRDGRAYCLSVRTTTEPSTDNLASRRWASLSLFDPKSRRAVDTPADILGPCRLYARHGMPGAEIGQWMLSAGATKAVERSDLLIPPVRASGGTRGWVFHRRQLVPSDVAFEGCRSGSAEACETLIFANIKATNDPVEGSLPVIQAGGVPVLESRTILSPLRSLGEVASDRALDAMEQRFGAEAFDRFWHSPKPPREAFVDAFGVAPADWGREWTRSLGPFENASVVPGSTETSLIVLYVGIMMAIAIGLTRRGRAR
jgi:hypothetical protein